MDPEPPTGTSVAIVQQTARLTSIHIAAWIDMIAFVATAGTPMTVILDVSAPRIDTRCVTTVMPGAGIATTTTTARMADQLARRVAGRA